MENVNEQDALGLGARVQQRLRDRERMQVTGIDPTSSRYQGRENEAGVRSTINTIDKIGFNPAAPGAQDAIRRAQVKDSLGKGRTTSLSSMDPGHPEYYGQTVALSGGARAKFTGPRRNPGRDRAIQDILNRTKDTTEVPDVIANMGRQTFKDPKGGIFGQSQIDLTTGEKDTLGAMRRRELDAMSDEELSKEVTAQAQKNFKSDLGKIEAENRAKEMEKYGFGGDQARYDAARSGYSDAMRKADDEYRYGGAKDEFDAGIASMQGQRQDIGYGAGSDRAGRHAINRQIAAKKQEARIARRNARREALGGVSKDEYMRSRAAGPPEPPVTGTQPSGGAPAQPAQPSGGAPAQPAQPSGGAPAQPAQPTRNTTRSRISPSRGGKITRAERDQGGYMTSSYHFKSPSELVTILREQHN